MVLKTIAVGTDRSPAAADAMQWAIAFGKASNARIAAISTWQMPFTGVLPEAVEGLPSIEFMADQCAQSLHHVVAGLGPEADVDEVVVEGKPGPALVEASSGADMLVVGRTGHGKRHGLARVAEIVLGSTARHCIHHARIPVAAVPIDAKWPEPATAVVGVDGSANSRAALAWALAHLPADCEVHVVRAFAPWVGDGLTPADLVTNKPLHDAFRHETQQWVDDALQRVDCEFENPVVVEVTIGNARDALSDTGYPMDLIVVGERGHTGVAGMVLGSVSDHLVRYATCPVIVVPDAEC